MNTIAIAHVLAVALRMPGAASNVSDGDAVELRRICQQMLDAIAPGHAKVWERFAHERLLHVDENGIVRTRAELLKELSPLPAGLVGRIAIDTFRVESHGPTAVLAYEAQEHLDYHGQTLRSRFRIADTWLKTSGGWRLLAQHISAVVKDPPATKMTRTQLCEYEGSYALTETITSRVRCDDDGLLAERSDRASRPPTRYLPEVRDVFFAAGQPRARRIFVRDPAGRIVAFVDRREGEDVRWSRRQ